MRFALLGDHPDGLDMARALAESGRHELAVYCGPGPGAEHLGRWDLKPVRIGDLEEVLADPRIDGVIVAGGPADRSAQLRRALQSERHVLCVHPVDEDPDSAYEAAMLQADTGQVVLPLLPLALHPGIRRLAELARPASDVNKPELLEAGMPTAVTASLPVHAERTARLGCLRLLEMELWSTERVLLDADSPAHEPGLPGWDVLRAVGGELREVSALAAAEELPADAPVIVAGVFQNEGMFQMVLLPNQPESRWRLTLHTRSGRSELLFPQGWPGSAHLRGLDENGAELRENWDTWNPWPRLVEAFEEAIVTNSRRLALGRVPGLRPGGTESMPFYPRQDVRDAITVEPRHALPTAPQAQSADSVPLTWQDEIRCLELDDAARRSVVRRRASVLEYQEATEEAGFKGTMTLVGCSLIWLSLVLLIVAVWVPWLIWLILPVFGVFLLLQLLRWVVPGAPRDKRDKN
jgi:hypothetical protein